MTATQPETLSFHARFALALDGDDRALEPWLPSASKPGMDVYRNTVAKGRADALAALYPSIERLVGADWFRQAALIYADQARPEEPMLDRYGENFPDWLANFSPAADMAWIAPVARLDRAWNQSHRAIDAPPLTPEAALRMDPAALHAGHAVLHPSAHFFWFDWTAPSIWLANREDQTPDDMVWEARPEGLLVVRPEMTVISHRLTRPQFAFLNACRDGRSVSAAVAAALRADVNTDLTALFSGLLLTGVFTRIEPGS